MKDMNNIILNPVRMRIIQMLAIEKTATATEICEKMPDVPRTTLYRHIKVLIDNSIVNVVAENRIRGSVERTLSLDADEITKHNTIENASQNVLSFLMNRYARFENYFKDSDADPGKDRIFFTDTVFMASDEEFDSFLMDLQKLFNKYSFNYADNRKPRDISIISLSDEKPNVKKEYKK